MRIRKSTCLDVVNKIVQEMLKLDLDLLILLIQSVTVSRSS